MRLLKLVALLAALAATLAVAAQADPQRNLEAILRPTASGPEKGFGLVKFRQPKDEETRIYLDVWVRDLAPDQGYYVQRAVDLSTPDGECASESGWLTLGTVTTDDTGAGRAALSRLVPPVFREFDIHFRLVDPATPEVAVLQSGCYQYTVSQ
jgi:hypothetical protein